MHVHLFVKLVGHAEKVESFLDAELPLVDYSSTRRLKPSSRDKSRLVALLEHVTIGQASDGDRLLSCLWAHNEPVGADGFLLYPALAVLTLGQPA